MAKLKRYVNQRIIKKKNRADRHAEDNETQLHKPFLLNSHTPLNENQPSVGKRTTSTLPSSTFTKRKLPNKRTNAPPPPPLLPRTKNSGKTKRLRSPGIEPGPPAWQARILPLDQLRVKHQAKEGDVGETKRVKIEKPPPVGFEPTTCRLTA